MLDNTRNKWSKFRTKKWVEINDELQASYKDDNQIKFKTSTIRSSLCDCSDPYTFVSGTITIKGEGDDDAVKRADERNKGVIFKNGVPLTDFVSNINVTQTDNAKDVDVVMKMYD